MASLIWLVALIALIWAEIKVFAQIGSGTSVLFVVVAVFATAAIGVRLFRNAGMATMMRLREAAASGRPPVLEMADGGAVVLAAGLLLLPGFITDAIGFVLFIPGLRTLLALGLFWLIFSFLQNRGGLVFGGFQHPGTDSGGPQSGQAGPGQKKPPGETIDGEFERKD